MVVYLVELLGFFVSCIQINDGVSVIVDKYRIYQCYFSLTPLLSGIPAFAGMTWFLEVLDFFVN